MAQAAHTPAPWRVVTRADRTGIIVSIAVTTDTAAGGWWELQGVAAAAEQNIADGRLIAAAPEMYEALKRLTVQMNNLLMVADVPDRFAASFNDGQRQADAAIARAEGRPQ
jgi:hypothetical protein